MDARGPGGVQSPKKRKRKRNNPLPGSPGYPRKTFHLSSDFGFRELANIVVVVAGGGVVVVVIRWKLENLLSDYRKTQLPYQLPVLSFLPRCSGRA